MLALFALGVAFALPSPSHLTDFLERCVDRDYKPTVTNTRVLIVTTSHSVLGPANCTDCKPTGISSAELTVPYYIFKDAGAEVTIASILGGPVPVDPMAKFLTHWDDRFWADDAAMAVAQNSKALETVDIPSFDAVFLVGGWGAAWDYVPSDELQLGLSAAWAKGKVLGSVCHGALGLVRVTKPSGDLLVNGTECTGVTNRQIEQLGIAKITPFHPETELKKAGAIYESSRGLLTDIDQSKVVVAGNLITGQNQNSGCETAQRMLKALGAQHYPASPANSVLMI